MSHERPAGGSSEPSSGRQAVARCSTVAPRAYRSASAPAAGPYIGPRTCSGGA
ncbi:hypothetical protein [Nonomuraea sp. NPDC005730]|uniref:hypothetical protein n=1 Tax=Nonomuraea sp. NPDC005730 TaxID=3157055 RepID=UPI0033D97830